MPTFTDVTQLLFQVSQVLPFIFYFFYLNGLARCQSLLLILGLARVLILHLIRLARSCFFWICLGWQEGYLVPFFFLLSISWDDAEESGLTVIADGYLPQYLLCFLQIIHLVSFPCIYCNSFRSFIYKIDQNTFSQKIFPMIQ